MSEKKKKAAKKAAPKSKKDVKYLYLNDEEDLTRLCHTFHRQITIECSGLADAPAWNDLDNARQNAIVADVKLLVLAKGKVDKAFEKFTAFTAGEQIRLSSYANTIRAVEEARQQDPGSRVNR